MQSQFQSFGDTIEALRKMRGIEFVLASHNEPDLFIIHKVLRESYDESAQRFRIRLSKLS